MHSSTRFLNLFLIFTSILSGSACTQVVVSQETGVRNDAVSSPASQTENADIGKTTTVVAEASPQSSTLPSPNVNTNIPPVGTVTPSTPAQPTTNTNIDGVEAKRLQDFQTRFETEAKSPQGAIRMLFLALLELEKAPSLAEAMVTVVYNGKKLTAESSSPTGFVLGSSERFILNQMKQRPEIVHSYLGGTPEKNYINFDATGKTILYPPNGAVINGLRVNNTLEGNAEGQIYIKSHGKDLPTPLRLERNNQGLFKIDPSSVSSVATGVKKPEPENF